jgi:hypothetical protein
MENETGWSLLVSGQLDQAIAALKKEHALKGDTLALSNLGLALLDAGDICGAMDLYKELAKKHDPWIDESSCIRLGLMNWLNRNYEDAVEQWNRGRKADIVLEGGGVVSLSLLWYAGVKLNDGRLKARCEKDLSRFLKPIKGRTICAWPGASAIAGYLAGHVDEADFMLNWRSPIEALEWRRQCRVNFWAGVKRLPDRSAASPYFAVPLGLNRVVILEVEYFLAKWEHHSAPSEYSA